MESRCENSVLGHGDLRSRGSKHNMTEQDALLDEFESNGKAAKDTQASMPVKSTSNFTLILLIVMVALTWGIAATAYFGIVDYKAVMVRSSTISSSEVTSCLSILNPLQYQGFFHPFRLLASMLIYIDDFLTGLFKTQDKLYYIDKRRPIARVSPYTRYLSWKEMGPVETRSSKAVPDSDPENPPQAKENEKPGLNKEKAKEPISHDSVKEPDKKKVEPIEKETEKKTQENKKVRLNQALPSDEWLKSKKPLLYPSKGNLSVSFLNSVAVVGFPRKLRDVPMPPTPNKLNQHTLHVKQALSDKLQHDENDNHHLKNINWENIQVENAQKYDNRLAAKVTVDKRLHSVSVTNKSKVVAKQTAINKPEQKNIITWIVRNVTPLSNDRKLIKIGTYFLEIKNCFLLPPVNPVKIVPFTAVNVRNCVRTEPSPRIIKSLRKQTFISRPVQNHVVQRAVKSVKFGATNQPLPQSGYQSSAPTDNNLQASTKSGGNAKISEEVLHEKLHATTKKLASQTAPANKLNAKVIKKSTMRQAQKAMPTVTKAIKKAKMRQAAKAMPIVNKAINKPKRKMPVRKTLPIKVLCRKPKRIYIPPSKSASSSNEHDWENRLHNSFILNNLSILAKDLLHTIDNIVALLAEAIRNPKSISHNNRCAKFSSSVADYAGRVCTKITNAFTSEANENLRTSVFVTLIMILLYHALILVVNFVFPE